jgi:hypothetical protein
LLGLDVSVSLDPDVSLDLDVSLELDVLLGWLFMLLCGLLCGLP